MIVLRATKSRRLLEGFSPVELLTKGFSPVELLTKGFSLVELLVVVAIIAILMSLVLPALRKAKIEGWKALSLANVRSIAQAGAAYQDDHQGYLPITPWGTGRSAEVQAQGGFCTWSAWGKNCRAEPWSTGWPNQFGPAGVNAPDVLALCRPLNAYLTSAPIPPVTDWSSRGRKIFELLVCRDPSDKVGHQYGNFTYWNGDGQAPENENGTSCYDDVGTSYQWQVKWHKQATYVYPNNEKAAFQLGARRFRLSDTYMPSRMIWLNDEWCDITMNRTQSNAKVINGYGEINRAVVGFLDGHVKYQKIIPGGESSPYAITEPWKVPAYNNADYAVVFPDLK